MFAFILNQTNAYLTLVKIAASTREIKPICFFQAWKCDLKFLKVVSSKLLLL